MPVAFVTDMGPMPAFEDDDYTGALAALGASLPRPKAVLIMSGHWDASGTLAATTSTKPPLIYDYSGFPNEWYDRRYPCPGAPDAAREAVRLLSAAGLPAREDAGRGLDHGAWVPLTRLYPKADVPVAQLTVPAGEDPARIAAVGRALAPLRDQGVLLLGSGALSHNLRMMRFGAKDAPPDGWAGAFDAWMQRALETGALPELLAYRRLAPSAALAAPTPEHFDPLFYALGAAGSDIPSFPYRAIRYGNALLRLIVFGRR